MSNNKSDKQVRQVPEKPDHSKQGEKRDGSHVPNKPGKPLYQPPTEPWPEKPKK